MINDIWGKKECIQSDTLCIYLDKRQISNSFFLDEGRPGARRGSKLILIGF